MDFSKIMEQAQQMQQKMKQIQEDLAKKTITGSAGGGMVQVTMNGQGEVMNVAIEKVLVNPDEQQMLQDLVAAATNDAFRKVKELGKQELGSLTGGLDIPGIANFLR